jgi:hypothetical protein
MTAKLDTQELIRRGGDKPMAKQTGVKWFYARSFHSNLRREAQAINERNRVPGDPHYKEVVKMMEKFRVPILVTLDSGEEELRNFSVEAWGLAEAIEIAEQQAQQDEHVVEVKPQVR